MMKKFLSFFIAAFMLVALPMAVDAKKDGSAKIEFAKSSHDFGVVKEDGGKVSCEFEFINTGDAPLVIIDAEATCGCTRPEYPKNPISPGKKGKIKVTYNPAGRPGPIDRVVTVRSNGVPKKVRLKLKGNVLPVNQE